MHLPKRSRRDDGVTVGQRQQILVARDEVVGPLPRLRGQQGALMVYVILIWFYARTMDKLDAAHSLGEE